MPNYRQKNKNRNKNRNRTKQQQQQKQQQNIQQTTQKEQEEEQSDKCEKVIRPTTSATSEVQQKVEKSKQVAPIEIADVRQSSLVEHQNDNTQIGNVSNDEPQVRPATQAYNDKDVEHNDDDKFKKITPVTENVTSLGVQRSESSDSETSTQEITQQVKKMGAKNCKNDTRESNNGNDLMSPEIVEAKQEDDESEADKAQKLHLAKVMLHRIVKETEPLHSQRQTSPDLEVSQQSLTQNGAVKVIFHRIQMQANDVGSESTTTSTTTSTAPELQRYQVMSPTNEFNEKKRKPRPNLTLMIQELGSDASLSDCNDNTPLVSEVESEDSESNTTSFGKIAAKNAAECVDTPQQHQQAQEDLRQRRVQKRAALENHFLPQLLSPRYLDCIIEENSDLSDARSDYSAGQQPSSSAPQTPETPNSGACRRADSRFPKSNLDFSRKHKHSPLPKSPTMPGAICEEPQAFIVETKEIAAPTRATATTLASSKIEPPSESPEIVFIDSASASSSMSDLLEDVGNNSEAEAVAADGDIDDCDETTLSAMDLDTDASDVISFTERNSSAASECTLTGDSREQTPVNQVNAPPTYSKTETQRVEDEKTFNIILNSNGDNDIHRSSRSERAQTKLSATESDKFKGNFESSAILKTITNSMQSFRDDRECADNFASVDLNKTAAVCFSLASPAAEIVESSTLLKTLEVEMNNVRDVLSSLDELAKNTSAAAVATTNTPLTESTIKFTPPVPPRSYQNENRNAKRDANSQSPPPLPPPPTYLQENHFTSIDSTTTPITTSAIINTPSSHTTSPHIEKIHNLPTPSTSLNSNGKVAMVRQESADSHCSDSTVNSQCTAINLYASPQQIGFDEIKSTKSYVSDDVSSASNAAIETSSSPIKKLRNLCTETLASMPYGEDVLLELAKVAQNISETSRNQTNEQKLKALSNQIEVNSNKMPYPLPDMPVIEHLHVPNSAGKVSILPQLRPAPPPPQEAALNMQQNESSWLGMPTENDPKLLVCFSPAQRIYIEHQKESVNQKPDDLLDAHQKYMDRRGYHELTKDQVRAINDEKIQEQQILETAAIMKKLRKSLTPPPPPVPPPPVPAKSSETAAKAQRNQNLNSQKQNTTMTSAVAVVAAVNASKNDAILENANEQQRSNANSAMKSTSTLTGEKPNNISMNNSSSNSKHRLLSIIHDDTTPIETKANDSINGTASEKFASGTTKASAFENNSRQAANDIQEITKDELNSQPAPFQQSEQPPIQNRHRVHFPTQNQLEHLHKLDTEMQSVESDLARMFPTMGASNIFDANRKRFSNIEVKSQSTPFCSADFQSTQPKRYSNIEMHSTESNKRIENGQIVYDYSSSKHESQKDGDENLSKTNNFPIKAEQKHAFPASAHDEQKNQQQQPPSQPSSSASHVGEIMSALKLNTKKFETNEAAKTPLTAPPALATTHDNSVFKNVFTNTSTQHQTQEHITKSTDEQSESAKVNPPVAPCQPGSYEEFRQRAKAAVDAIFSDAKHANLQQPSTHRSSLDHEKLFKDFDELSNQLKAELEAGKAQRVQREKSASLYDLSRMQMQYSDQFKELKESRHEHMRELEREIERSMRSRQSKQRQSQEPSHVHEIPIKIENGQASKGVGSFDTTDNAPTGPHVRAVPIRLEVLSPYQVTSPVPPLDYASDSCYDSQNRRYHRAESMFDLANTKHRQQAPPQRERSYSNQYDGHVSADDWSRYASDLGSSENITRPFAREVEICYQRQQRQPRTIRAPRLTVSTNDLANNYLSAQTYDSFNAYNVRRTHAPMLSPVPPQTKTTKPQYLSCYSLLERDPNPTYIGTTTRRGVSPAPTSPQPPCNEQTHFSVNEREMRQRRASLPRELQQQQLHYIMSKEEELKTEFQRLQNERERLLEEMRKELNVENEKEMASTSTPTSPTLLPPITPPPRHAYRPAPPRRLPTLSEDEVFRQQMAEEWLNKVAEREERRLQKIIKISKAHEVEHARQVPIELSTNIAGANVLTSDIGSEFLKRVKERRTKLEMPADSDWESGAESQPQPATGAATGHASETEDLPPIKVYDGKSEANLRQLPKHIREFAKFSSQQSEKIDGGQREMHQEEERRQEANDNSFSSASKKTSVMKTVKITRQHPYQQLNDGRPTSICMGAASSQANQGEDNVSDGSACLTTNTIKQDPNSKFAFPATLAADAKSSNSMPKFMISSTVTTHKTNFSPLFVHELPETHTLPTPHAKTQFFKATPNHFTISDHFADSPFKNKIYEEFDQFWQRINSRASTNNAGIHQKI